jgi:tetratricopeptide (TPR) repeat protein
MKKALLLPLLLAAIVAAAPAAARAAEPAGADTVLIFPFENTSHQGSAREYNWIGESFSEMLSELLDATNDLTSIRPDERNLAYERLGLPTTAVLTRATSIKIGEQAEADLIIVGTYRVDGEKNKETITVTARLIDLREGRLVGNREFNRGGLLKDLQELQGDMAYEILKQRNPSLPFSRGDVVGAATKIPNDAFADFMKAVTTSDRPTKAKFLGRAIDEYAKGVSGGQFTQAIFELGRIAYLDGKWDDAVKLLTRVDPKYPRYIEAQFYLGIAYASSKQNDAAVKVFTDLVPRMPLYEVYNNAGVVYLRAGRIDDAIIYLKPAAEAATRDLDTQFNYGYALWLKGDYAGAAAQLQKAVRRKPADSSESIKYGAQDGEAFYLLAKASERGGKAPDAAEALDQAKRYLPQFAQWETKKQIPDLSRLKVRFSRVALGKMREQLGPQSPPTSSAPDGGATANEAMARARGLFAANNDRAALDQLGRVLQVNPDNAEAHLLRGRIYERGGDYPRAIEALKAATFWDPKSVPAYVALGRIYVFRNDCPNAQATMRKALQIEPTSQEVLALKRTVEQKCGQ